MSFAIYLIVFSTIYIIRESNKEAVDWNLVLPPDETNRISTPDGMSIICPAGWKYSVDTDLIAMTGQTPSNRQLCRIIVSRLTDDATSEKIRNDPSFQQITFQDEIAFEKISSKKGTGVEAPSITTGEKYFWRSGQCYRISYFFGLCETLPENAQLYFNSFSVTASDQNNESQ